MAPPNDPPATEAWQKREGLVKRFEAAWLAGGRPDIDDYLSEAGALRREVLLELVHGDLELRLRAGEPARVEDYLRRYPELGQAPDDVVGLIVAEHALRRPGEPELAPEEYARRFPQHRAALEGRLPVSAPPPAVRSAADLVRLLHDGHLLTPDQGGQLARLQESFPEPRALAAELIRRGWLTPFQVNQLFLGKGAELRLGSYVLLERLGEGGMGAVFKARNWKLGRVVALKLIRRERLAHPEAVRRFQREVRSAARLSHPNVVLAHDADEVNGAHFLVLEHVEGTDLARLVREQGPLPVDVACDCVRQAALGLQHAFERGLVHRDVKPSNLVLATAPGPTGARVVKVLDLGLARATHRDPEAEASGTMTEEGALMGTPDYIAPEQVMDARTADVRADLYSLGCTLYFLLTGRVPFPGGTLMQKFDRHRHEEPAPVERLRPDVPPALAAVVRRLMAKRPEDRFQSPAEVAEALAALPATGGETLPAGAPGPTVRQEAPGEDTVASAYDYMVRRGLGPPAQPRAGRRRLLVAVAVAVLLVGGALLLALLMRRPGEGKVPDGPPGPPKDGTAAKGDDDFHKRVASLPAGEQVKVVVAELKKRNPGFDGLVTRTIEGDFVTGLHVPTDKVKDLGPVRALTGLRALSCRPSEDGKSHFSDLSQLGGTVLTRLDCSGTRVSDLTPLEGMKTLTSLGCYATEVKDLSPLKGLNLTSLECGRTQVSDLSPLRGLELRSLNCCHTQVSNLSPLKRMKTLTSLGCYATEVSDLSPLKGLKLTELYCDRTKVADLSPLRGMPLVELVCDFQPERDGDVLRSITTLRTINGKPAMEFWKEVEAARPRKKP